MLFKPVQVRIVRDAYSGYEVQVKHWYWPFWRMPKVNTFGTIERAREYAKQIKEMQTVVENV